jgi:hypothetical protein
MTRAQRLAVVVVTAVLLAPPVLARQAQPVLARQAPPPATQSTPDSLGVSLKQIRQQLKDVPEYPRAPGSGMRYDFFVNVYGTRPAIEFFKDFDLSLDGPVKWGGVTHQEILNAITPYPFQHYGSGIDLMAQFKKKYQASSTKLEPNSTKVEVKGPK